MECLDNSNLQNIQCPVCGYSGDFVDIFIPNDHYAIQKYGKLYGSAEKSCWKICGNCGFVHQNPRPTIESLNRYYLNSEYHPEVRDETFDKPDNYKPFSDWYYREKVEWAISKSKIKGGGKVFEIGFGQGGALLQFMHLGWQPSGVEADNKLFSYARKTLNIPGLEKGILHKNSTLEQKADLIFSNHVFEHIADLEGAMNGIQNILKPGGYIVTIVPTYYRNRSNMSRKWMNATHYSVFTHKTLNILFNKYGIEEVDHNYRAWSKEIDDLWHIARFTGKTQISSEMYTKPRIVSRYLHVINPLRTTLFSPIYSFYPTRVKFINLLKYQILDFFKNPLKFFYKAFNRLKATQKKNLPRRLI